MKKKSLKTIAALMLVFIFGDTGAQNLVFNPGFEDHSSCPNDYSQIDFAYHWHRPSDGSPDYFNTCGTGYVGIPNNDFGYQSTHNGDGYAGIWIYYNEPPFLTDYREYLMGELSEPLIAGKCYHFEMYVNSSDNAQKITDDIGVYFSNTMISVPTSNVLSGYTAVVSNPSGEFANTTDWLLVSGDFTAVGGEQYFVIGNFLTNANTTLIPNGSGPPGSYFYVDDVSVTACPPTCTSNSDTTVHVCPTGLPYTWNGNSYNVPGTYSVLLTTANGCDSTATLNLQVLATSSGSTNKSICSSQLPYVWNGATYNTAGIYIDTLVNVAGCDSIATLNLMIYPIPEVNLGIDTTICMGKTMTLNIARPGGAYLWQDGSTAPGYNINKEGLYWVRITLNGCSNSDSVMVDFKDCDCMPMIPNAFTPNGDGINDQWIIAHQYCDASIAVMIYNRYGSLVYHSDNYQNDWKGTYRSGTCPDGTYYYVMKLVYVNHKEAVFKGNVTILR